MRTLIRSEIEVKNFRLKSETFRSKHKFDNSLIFLDNKFYQKIIAMLISISIILIFPESPKKLEDVCKAHNSSQICNVW